MTSSITNSPSSSATCACRRTCIIRSPSSSARRCGSPSSSASSASYASSSRYRFSVSCVCSRSHGQPPSGLRSCATTARSPSNDRVSSMRRERRHVQRRQVVEAVSSWSSSATRRLDDALVAGAARADDAHRMLGRVRLEQRQLRLRCRAPVVHLRDHRRPLRRRARGRASPSDSASSTSRPSVSGSRPSAAATVSTKLTPATMRTSMPASARAQQQRPHRRLAEQRVAGHGVHDALAACAASSRHACDDGRRTRRRTTARARRRRRTSRTRDRRQAGDGRVARGAQPDLGRGGEHIARLDGEQRRVARAEPDDRDVGAAWSHYGTALRARKATIVVIDEHSRGRLCHIAGRRCHIA